MSNNVKQMIKDLMYIIGMFLLICLLLLVILLNSYGYPHYVASVESIKIKFMDCEYWKNNQIPNNLTNSQKWKIITTIGECNIIEKKFFLEKNINDENIFHQNLLYMDIKHKERIIGVQSQLYLRKLNGKSDEDRTMNNKSIF